MFHDAFRYPIRDEEAVGTLVIGTLLVFVGGVPTTFVISVLWAGSPAGAMLFGVLFSPVIVIPWLLVLGFTIGVLRRTITGNDKPPRFESWGRLLADGVRGTIVLAVYATPTVAILVAASVGPAFASTVLSGSWPISTGLSSAPIQRAIGSTTTTTILEWGPLLLAGIVGAVASYPAAVTLCGIAASGGLIGAVSTRTVTGGTTVQFALGWIGAIGTVFFALILVSPLVIVLVGATGLFYAITVGARLIGTGYRPSLRS